MAESDNWGTASAAGYDGNVALVTGPSAEHLISMVDKISPLSHPTASAFDNGAGTGVVTTALRARFPDIPILAADLSPGMLEAIEKKKLPDVQCRELDATDLRAIADDTFTHSFSTFMIQFAPDPHRALQEMYRVTKSGGTLGLGVWGEMHMDRPWEDTVRHFEHDPNYRFPHTWSFDWKDPECLRSHIQNAGFKDIKMECIRPHLGLKSAEDYCRLLLDSKNPEWMRGFQPWWDRGMEGIMRPVLKNIVKEKYGGAKDFAMEVLLFIARK